MPSSKDELDKAIQRVELAKKKLAEIEKQETEARKMMDYINQIETRVNEVGFFFICHTINNLMVTKNESFR